MSDHIVIRLEGVGKMYKIFSSRADNLLDALGFSRIGPFWGSEYREFWALRRVDFELRSGRRIGIIGRNGSGKTTLLKLITGNLLPTEGNVEVVGKLQALMDAGAGFHPEFTGYENIRASLTYLGLSPAEIKTAEADIAEFTELEDFMNQPFKTYSAGMQARLAFAAATAIDPEIVVIDEILGAGDAYFIAKSAERIKRITGGGASMVVVSHSMTQITQLCEEAIWLERGQIQMRGPSLEVVKSYEKFVRELEEKRLRAKNLKARSGRVSPLKLENSPDLIVLRFIMNAVHPAVCEISEVKLFKSDEEIECLQIGSVQDANGLQSAFVILSGSDWSAPIEIQEASARQLKAERGADSAEGSICFNLLTFEAAARYEISIRYRCPPTVRLQVESWKEGNRQMVEPLLPTDETWRTQRVVIAAGTITAPSQAPSQKPRLFHWPGEGSLRIVDMELFGDDGQVRTVFQVNSRLTFRAYFHALQSGRFRVLPCVNIYRIDGTNISTQLGEWLELEMEKDVQHTASLELESLNLGNGYYTISIAFYKSLDLNLNQAPVVYDWIDRSLEFQVVGTPPAINSVFQHPSTWKILKSG